MPLAEQPFDIFGDDVDFQVDRRPDRLPGPGSSAARVVGISETSNQSRSSADTVSDTPSTVIEPFSTT